MHVCNSDDKACKCPAARFTLPMLSANHCCMGPPELSLFVKGLLVCGGHPSDSQVPNPYGANVWRCGVTNIGACVAFWCAKPGALSQPVKRTDCAVLQVAPALPAVRRHTFQTHRLGRRRDAARSPATGSTLAVAVCRQPARVSVARPS